MITISLCMIVKNEEQTLARCLDSVLGVADEIIIVDTGSTDRTKEIAMRYTERVYDFTWIDDFSAARNEAFSRATKDYCLWLDADDVLLKEDKQQFLQLKQMLSPEINTVMMRYHIAFDADGKPTFSYYRERLIRNRPEFRWQGAVHEAIVYAQPVVYSDIAVTHQKVRVTNPRRNLEIYQKLIEKGEVLQARQKFYYAREWFDLKEYQQAADAFEVFLEDETGWIENRIEACRQLAVCYRQLGQNQNGIQALLKTLSFDIPRAEVCCDIAQYFLEQRNYQTAIYWYETALKCPRKDKDGGFVNLECYGYLPLIQLCVCYDRLGAYQKAFEYNEAAGKIQPNSSQYQYNRTYFEQKHGLSLQAN